MMFQKFTENWEKRNRSIVGRAGMIDNYVYCTAVLDLFLPSLVSGARQVTLNFKTQFRHVMIAFM